MKNLLLAILFILTILQAPAQDYCLYNSQKAYNFGENYSDEPFKIIEQLDGRFLVIGTGYTNVTNSFHIVGMRVFPNGNLDPTFGNQGKINHTFSQRNSAICATLQDDGKILIGGYQATSNGLSGFEPYVARFNSDGSVDTTFGDNGSALIPNSNSYPGETTSIRCFPDGSIKVVANLLFSGGIVVSKLLPSGAPDLDFGSGGYVEHLIAGHSLGYNNPSSQILSDGSFLEVARYYDGVNFFVGVTKLNADGYLVTDFGDGGTSNITSVMGSAAIVRSARAFDGNILASLRTPEGLPYVLKIDFMTGDIVSEFGTDGVLYAPIESVWFESHQLVPDDSNEEWIILFGNVSEDVATMRIDDNGNILNDCSSFLNIPSINSTGSQSYTCGLFDQQGVLRISGQTGVTDSTSSWTFQNLNFMWPYYEPPSPNPIVLSVTPNQLLVGEPVELSINGFGFNDAQEVRIVSNLDTIYQSSIEFVNDEVIQAVFYPETTSLGMKDVIVYLSNDTLMLEQAVEVIGEEYVDGDVNFLSRTQILAGGLTVFAASYTNKGNKAMLATPLIVVNENPYTMDFTNQPKYNLQEDDAMIDLVSYLVGQGIDPSIVNSTVFEDEGNQHHGFLTTNLSPQESKNIGAMTTITEAVMAEQNIYLHPNPIVGNEGMLETYLPDPGYCTQEMVLSSLLLAIPGAEISGYESCFNLSYSQLQIDLAGIVREINDERVVPLKGAMMKLLYDLMSCIDNTYEISEAEFELFNAEMALLFATDVILDEEFPCESYVEASTYYHGLIEAPLDDVSTNAFDKADPWGIGIDFNFCYGCKTMNDIDGVASLDPNEKIGPSQEFGGTFINNGDMFYSIHFENVDSADIAAKTVYIVDTLDTEKLDVTTFKFTNVSWDDNVEIIDGEPNITEFDLRPEVPNILRVTTTLDEISGIATWKFETLDTLSLYPTEDIDQGFLPPNITAPEGMGFVSFEVQLFEDVESGSTIENDAQIFFDFNDPITTNNWINTFDNEVPESHVNEITDYVVGDNVVNVSWETEEADQNILFYNIFYNTDGSDDWTPWMVQTTDMGAEFTGEVGMTYYFMSVAVDSAFNVEEYADEYDAFIFMEPVGIEEVDGEQSFKLFPNPAKDRLVVSVEGEYFDTITLTDMTGRVVLVEYNMKGSKQYVIELGNVSSGVYNVSIANDRDNIIGRSTLVVQ